MKSSSLFSIVLVAAALGGCAITPSGAIVPVGVAYVAPTYAVPGPGYAWAYHADYGWGWHHPYYGWHRGWH
jgi:hypothetical protein